ncbi:conserved hypothetical protein [Desulforapulum autotrophicum HRM2]|uniref:DUF364 domain-containing protein n=1 Tax=Desulforapulum autotrophicum (strain ATCC 43914 / DSM 3382 / VKM B-1955 / HRM2) TaxID=177437 RepID=C0Q8X0_DESAH|nr:DUF364 domain-containing protein [Desulforapulum autotrophicum]ACN14460.1 conserved hypothetical protein [Desulforapulum autotrophicum HRM2]
MMNQTAITQTQVIDHILSQLETIPDQDVTCLTYGAHIVSVESSSMGIATWACGQHPISLDSLPEIGSSHSVKTIAGLLHDKDPMKSSLGLAAVNSLLPDPLPGDMVDVNAGDLILELGRKKRVAVIGHFPFVERMKGKFKELMVFEKKPQSGDLEAGLIPKHLPSADIVAITATTLSNGTLAGILACCQPSAVKLIIGPSTPVTPALFALGFDYVAGVVVQDGDLVKKGIEEGCSFKQIRGVSHVILQSQSV